MSNLDTPELLRAYAEQGSEAAFQELVSRYINLVYSAALRRANGNTHFAEEVVQAVFTDLADKATTLPGKVMLGGWLHRHTGFVASNLLRVEQRRAAREQEAAAMNLLHESSDSDWKQLAPVLDEAIDLLEAADRNAIVLRYLEQRDLRAVGLALGVTEDAAQKRVSRALEKLRALLVEHGATLTIAVLAAALSTETIVAAPAQLAARVSKTALAGKAAGLGLAAWLLKWLSSASGKLAAGALAAAVAAVVLLRPHEAKAPGKSDAPAARRAVKTTEAAPVAVAAKAAPPAATAMAAVKTESPTNAPELRLTIVSAETGKPLRNVQVKLRAFADSKFNGQTLRGSRDGICDVNFKRGKTTSLELTTQIEGYADTKLQWRPDRGEAVPAEYSLRLVRATPIGGTVIDADGQPVAGAKVGFNHEDDMASKALTENHEFGYIEVTTDAEGRWHINRMAPEMIRRIRGGAKHPEHVDSPYKFVSHDAEMEKQLRDGTHVYQLGRPIAIRGVVVDADGKPVPSADVTVGGKIMSDRRNGKTEADGTFVVKGCKPGKNLLSADVKGFATTTIEIEATADSEPFRLTVQRGKSLRLRIVNKAGAPIPGATVGLDTNPFNPVNPMKPKSPAAAPQASFSGKADADGRVVWDGAPDAELTFYFYARDYMNLRDVKVRPDGQEHVITLPSALVISGTVSDAETGGLIPKFRIITGSPRIGFKPPAAGAAYNPAGPQMTTNAMWSTLERFWLTFANGQYRHAFDEPVVGGDGNRGYYLKFEAEGYSPYVSRLISADEGEAHLNVALRPARTLVVTVLQPDGNPAAIADIGLASPGANLSLAPGGLSRKNPQSGGSLLATDAKGQFKLAPDDAIIRVIITHASGFAEATPATLAAESTVHLQPWGNIEGVYYSGGQPAAGREIKFEYATADPEAIKSDFTDFRVETDAQGRFAFHDVPAGKHQLIRLVPTKPPSFAGTQPGTKSWRNEPLGEVEVRAGETTSVRFGTNNYSVIVRLQWPEGLQATANSRAFLTLSTPPPPASLLAARSDPKAMQEMRNSPEFQTWAASLKRFNFAENADGSFTAEGIAPGTYSVDASVMEEAPRTYRQVAMGNLNVTVPAEPPSGTLDLGAIRLQKAGER